MTSTTTPINADRYGQRPDIVDDVILLSFLGVDYGGWGGGTRLAAALRCSTATGCKILRGHAPAAMIKVAALYKYVPMGDGSGRYRYSPQTAPFPWTVGRKRADLDEHKEYILECLLDKRVHSIADAVKISGFSYGTVKRIHDELLSRRDAA